MLKRFKELLADTLTYGASGVLTQLLGFFLIPLYTTFLRPADYGIIAMLSLVAQLFLALASLGFRTSVCKEYYDADADADADDRRRRAVTTALVAVAGAALLLLVTCQLAAAPMARILTQSDENTRFVRIELVTAALSTISGLLLTVLQAARDVRKVAAFNVTKSLTFIAVNVLLVAVLRWGLFGYLVAELAVEALYSLVLLRVASRYLGNPLGNRVAFFSRPLFVRMLRYGAPFVPARLMGIAMSLFGTFVVAGLLGMHETGLYSMAMKFASPLALAVSAFSTAWAAYKFKVRKDEDRPEEFFATATLYVTGAIVYLWVGVSAWGPELLRVLTKPDFHSASGLVYVVAFANVPLGMNFLLGTGVELVEDTRRVPLITLAGLAAAVVTALALAPRLGSTGAALATVSANATMAYGYYRTSRHIYPIPFAWRTLAALVLGGAALVLMSKAAQGAHLPVRLGVAILVSLVFPPIALFCLGRSAERARLKLVWESFRRRAKPPAAAVTR